MKDVGTSYNLQRKFSDENIMGYIKNSILFEPFEELENPLLHLMQKYDLESYKAEESKLDEKLKKFSFIQLRQIVADSIIEEKPISKILENMGE